MEKTIYVRLLNEGTSVLRPVSATEIQENIFKLSDHISDDEVWEFAPGSAVLVQEKIIEGELVLVATQQYAKIL